MIKINYNNVTNINLSFRLLDCYVTPRVYFHILRYEINNRKLIAFYYYLKNKRYKSGFFDDLTNDVIDEIHNRGGLTYIKKH